MPEDWFGLSGRVLDQLEFGPIIGEGGFSIVYRGKHQGLGEPVAIKCLKLPTHLEPELAEQFVGRFRDECRLAYRLSQGSLDIVRSITSGTTQGPNGLLIPYMVLEWLEGRSLGGDMRDRKAKGLPARTLQEAITLMEPGVQALSYAHSQGIVHRDVKPGNLFIAKTRHGPRMKVLDFGLAKILKLDYLGITPSVQTLGNFYFASPSYGAPEQFGHVGGTIGPWTDVYALALVFLEVLLDRKVRHAGSIADAVSRSLEPEAELSPHALGLDVSDQVNEVFRRALSNDPIKRPQTAGEFWGELRDSMLNFAGPASISRTIVESALPSRVASSEPPAAQMPAPGALLAPPPPPDGMDSTMVMPGRPLPGAPVATTTSRPPPAQQPLPAQGPLIASTPPAPFERSQERSKRRFIALGLFCALALAAAAMIALYVISSRR